MSVDAAEALAPPTSRAETPDAGPRYVDPALLKLLRNRYGDGLVYLRGSEDRELCRRAGAQGLISTEGYVTSAGRSLLSLVPSD